MSEEFLEKVINESMRRCGREEKAPPHRDSALREKGKKSLISRVRTAQCDVKNGDFHKKVREREGRRRKATFGGEPRVLNPL